MKQVVKFLLLIFITPFLVLLPFALKGHYVKSQARRQVWANAEHILIACDLLREYSPSGSEGYIISVDRKGSSVPCALQKLEPSAIAVFTNFVQIGLSGGANRFGLMAYAPGVTSTGTVEIIPRLWWYED